MTFRGGRPRGRSQDLTLVLKVNPVPETLD